MCTSPAGFTLVSILVGLLGCDSREAGMDTTELEDFGSRYASAWSSQDPVLLASFYAADGSLTVNDGPPSIGRAAIAATAADFMTGFPDMVVRMDDISVSERVVRFLWAYSPPPRRRELADMLAMSERNLTRQLGKEGTSYAALLAQVQTERAMNLLRNPALSVTEVGHRLGYSEPAAFSRAFFGWTGLSPLKWRQQV